MVSGTVCWLVAVDSAMPAYSSPCVRPTDLTGHTSIPASRPIGGNLAETSWQIAPLKRFRTSSALLRSLPKVSLTRLCDYGRSRCEVSHRDIGSTLSVMRFRCNLLLAAQQVHEIFFQPHKVWTRWVGAE